MVCPAGFFRFFYVCFCMDSLFSMGFNWYHCCAVIFFSPLLLFSQDAEILSAIGDVESAVRGNTSVLSDISSDVSHIDTINDSIKLTAEQISYSVDSIDSKLGYYNKTLQSDISVLVSSLQSISRFLNGVGVNSGGGVYGSISVRDDVLADSFDSFQRDYKIASSIVTNQLDDVISAINNLTNYLCYSQEYISSFPTNLPALLVGTYFGSIVDDQEQVGMYFSSIFEGLYGREPTSSELEWFTILYQAFGISQIPNTFFYGMISCLPEFDEITNSLGGNYSDVYSYLRDSVWYPTYSDISDLFYYEYGTRPLIQYFEQATNDFPITQSIITESRDSGDSQSRFSSGFIDTVGSLSSSFLPSVSTNVSNLSTGAIDQVANNSFQSFGEGLKSYDNSDLDTAVSLINNSAVIEDFAQYFQDHQSGDFSFTFDLHSLSSGVGEVNLTIHNQTSKTTPLIHFICEVLKVAITLIFIGKSWNDIIKPSPLFFP